MTFRRRTRGMILGKICFREADYFCRIFTEDFGYVSLLAKGVRNAAAKLSGSLALFNFLEIEFVQGQKWGIITDAIAANSFLNIKENLEKLRIAFEISFCFNELVREGQEDKKIWKLLLGVFLELNKADLKNESANLLFYYYFWNLMSVLGYKPEIKKCLVCGRNAREENSFFSNESGGLLCSFCKGGAKEQSISLETMKVLRIILDGDWQLLKRIKTSNLDMNNLALLSQSYLEFRI